MCHLDVDLDRSAVLAYEDAVRGERRCASWGSLVVKMEVAWHDRVRRKASWKSDCELLESNAEVGQRSSSNGTANQTDVSGDEREGRECQSRMTESEPDEAKCWRRRELETMAVWEPPELGDRVPRLGTPSYSQRTMVWDPAWRKLLELGWQGQNSSMENMAFVGEFSSPFFFLVGTGGDQQRPGLEFGSTRGFRFQ